MGTLNDKFIKTDSELKNARKGLLTLTKTTLFPGIALYRFANTINPGRFYTGPWWMGFSPFEALKQYAEARQQSLALAAAQCLAIAPEWSKGKMADVIVKAVVKQRLSAWSGTPKTQLSKIAMGAGKANVRRKPDRDITQLYIPGLWETDPNDSSRKIWQSAFTGPWRFYIGTK